MAEEAKLSFYEVKECGYYESGSASAKFGLLPEMLSDLQAWTSHAGKRKKIKETATFAVKEDSNIFPVYCLDLVADPQTGDFVLATWNETPLTAGQSASLRVDQSVGAATADLSKFPAHSIPGYSTYFWFIPSRMALATVRFHHPHNGHPGLVHYLKSYLGSLSSHAAREQQSNGEFLIRGYRHDGRSDAEDLTPRFSTSLCRKRTQISFIEKNRAKIRRVLRKSRLRVSLNRNVDTWQALLSGLNLGPQNRPTTQDFNFRYEAAFTPDENSLKEIIAGWEAESSDEWNDVGFVLAGEHGPRWLSRSVVRTNQMLDVTRIDAELVDPASLLTAITHHRESLLAHLSDKKTLPKPIPKIPEKKK